MISNGAGTMINYTKFAHYCIVFSENEMDKTVVLIINMSIFLGLKLVL